MKLSILKRGMNATKEIVIKDSLNLGSRIPLDLDSITSGTHTLVDPYFANLEKPALKDLRDKHPNVEFVPSKAHEFLKDAIKRGVKYKKIRIDCPYAGIIGESADFQLLCKEMKKVLTKDGEIEVLTEYPPNSTGVCRKYGDNDDMDALYSFLKGRELSELSDSERAELIQNVREEKTVNIVEELKKSGFEVGFKVISDASIISRSETALKRQKSGLGLYLIRAWL